MKTVFSFTNDMMWTLIADTLPRTNQYGASNLTRIVGFCKKDFFPYAKEIFILQNFFKMREIVNIQLGQCGNQIGEKVRYFFTSNQSINIVG